MPRLLAFLKLLRDERERDLGHFTPSVVNGQGMPAAGYFTNLGHAGILLLLLIGGMGDRPRHGVVVLAGDDQQRPTLGVLRVDLGFRPRVEVGGGRLEERHTGAGHRVRLVQLASFALVYGGGGGEPERLARQPGGAPRTAVASCPRCWRGARGRIRTRLAAIPSCWRGRSLAVHGS